MSHVPAGRSRAVTKLALVAALTVISVVAIAASVLSRPPAFQAPGTQPQAGLTALPATAQGPISAAVGRSDSAYRVHGLQAVNPEQRLGLRFGPGGVVVASGGSRLTMRLSSVGRGETLTPVGSVAPRASSNRVTYAHPGVSEWYANGPLGLEQGFDVAARPAGSGTLTLAVRADGLRARLLGGEVVFAGGLRYGQLRVTDAHRHAVPAWLTLSSGLVLLHVADGRAAYPLRVDPMVEQQKLVPSDELGGGSAAGFSVAVSADGNTALVGGPYDKSDQGATWVFVRSGSSWTEQAKIQPSDILANAEFGASAALSADGSTALIGGPHDNGVGAAWVYTRSGTTWTEQQKIIPSDAIGAADFGEGVALTPDGTTVAIGGFQDNSGVGAAWVYTRSGSTWSEQRKIVPTDATGAAAFGRRVALSSDGNTLLTGGTQDNGAIGAGWVYTRSGTSWSEQQKIVPGDEHLDGVSRFGAGVALNAGGTTALIGGENDSAGKGAAWVYVRSGSSWSEQQKLQPADEVGTNCGSSPCALFGFAVSLSSDGSTALIGGPQDTDTRNGAAWLYARSGTTWSEQSKLYPSDQTGNGGNVGRSVALTPDGAEAILGSPYDNANVGAATVFVSPPTNSSLPTISGEAQQGQTLTASNGSWAGNPSSFTYQWEDCDSSGAGCTSISGATAQTYTLQGSDVGQTVRVIVTASNTGGSTPATSGQTGVVAANTPPSNLAFDLGGPVTQSGSTIDPGINLSCPAGGQPCTASETATVVLGQGNLPKPAHATQTATVGSASFTIPAGSSVEATFSLNQLGVTLMSDHKGLPIQISLSGQAQGQSPVTATKSITVKGTLATFKVTSIKVARNGAATVKVKVSVPGQVNVLITAWNDNIAGAARLLNPAQRRFVVARASRRASSKGTLTLHLKPTARGRKLLAHPAYRVTLRIWVSYTPLYAFQVDIGYFNAHPGTGCSTCRVHRWP